MTILVFGFAFVFACLGALRWPLIGVLGYMVIYIIAPDRQWWGQPYSEMGTRFCLYLSICTAAGLVLHWHQFRPLLSGTLPHSQEVLVGAFVVVVVLSRVWGVPIDNSARDLTGISVSPSDKMPKVAIFVCLMTMIVARYKSVNALMWLLVIVGGLYLGWDGYTARPSRFVRGRLDNLGGADFAESSAVGAHLAFISVLTGVLFLKSSQLWKKAICLISGAFVVNAIILTQTRAALLALAAAGVCAPLLVMRGYRLRILAYLCVAGFGFFMLTNSVFWSRVETMTVPTGELEASAASRPELWSAGLRMWQDNPLGVGAGSFYTCVGDYDPRYVGRDCHNTYVRCLAELGVFGVLVFGALLINAFWTLRRTERAAEGTAVEREIKWYCFGLKVAFIAYLVAGVFMGLTYIEEMWWFLCLPVCLERAAMNARAEVAADLEAHEVVLDPAT